MGYYALPPIQPSHPPQVYCAECGCEVYPAAWLCANCGKKLHEPGAMTSTRPFANFTAKKTKPDIIIGAYLFVLLVGVVLGVLYVASEMHRFAKYTDRFDYVLFVLLILSAAFWIIDGLYIYFDRQK